MHGGHKTALNLLTEFCIICIEIFFFVLKSIKIFLSIEVFLFLFKKEY